MAITIGELTAKLGLDARDFQKGAAQFENAIGKMEAKLGQVQVAANRAGAGLRPVETAAKNAVLPLRQLEGGLRGVAVMALGIPGPVGRVASVLLQFAGGSALALGVAAGIGAIALAYRELTKDAKAAAEEQAKLLKAFLALDPLKRKAAEESAAAMIEAIRVRDEAQKLLMAGGRMIDIPRGQGVREQRFVPLGEKERAQLEKTVADINRTFADLRAAAQAAAKAQGDLATEILTNILPGITVTAQRQPLSRHLAGVLPPDTGLRGITTPARVGPAPPVQLAAKIGQALNLGTGPMKALDGAIQGVTAVLGPMGIVSGIVTGALQEVGAKLANALAPVIEVLAKIILKAVEIIASVMLFFVRIWAGIFRALAKIPLIGKLFKPMASALTKLENGIRKFRDTLRDTEEQQVESNEAMARSADEATEATRNMVEGFKIALFRFKAATGSLEGLADDDPAAKFAAYVQEILATGDSLEKFRTGLIMMAQKLFGMNFETASQFVDLFIDAINRGLSITDALIWAFAELAKTVTGIVDTLGKFQVAFGKWRQDFSDLGDFLKRKFGGDGFGTGLSPGTAAPTSNVLNLSVTANITGVNDAKAIWRELEGIIRNEAQRGGMTGLTLGTKFL